GSHGGATAEGQVEVLDALGVTEESVEAPIRSSMEVVQLGTTDEGIPVYWDKIAAEADGVIVLNRVKPHTEFNGDLESGIFKMIVIGLGKHRGAATAHQYTVPLSYRTVIPSCGRLILEKANVLAGVAVVENAYHQIAEVAVLAPGEIEAREKALLVRARDLMARLPFEDLDVLVVDEIGKDISGTGMDTNVIGRLMFIGEPEPESPRIKRIVVRDLTAETLGSALGIGLADFVTRRAAEKVDRRVTNINALTAVSPEKARIPLTTETDREAIELALANSGPVTAKTARLVRIQNTLHLKHLIVSEALVPSARSDPRLTILEEIGPMSFDGTGTLPAFPAPSVSRAT
ncbi:MAG TPA: lactate racemase domain-containing protein, partial [Dehalococcoidia bacterium]|nr:lactate racemase domain-containing protein [Dehalococcoidia bacterium]